MRYPKKLGVFVRVPKPGEVKTRLTPPLSADQACELYRAFLQDLSHRLSKLKKIEMVVFYAGDNPAALEGLLPDRCSLIAQSGGTLGERLSNAFGELLATPGTSAAIIGSDSPDLPLSYIKRAFIKLKHKDVVLGPASDGGYYLIALRSVAGQLFDKIDWGTDTVFHDTLARVADSDLECSMLPLWYDVDSADSLGLLKNMVRARCVEKRDRLHNIEQVLAKLNGTLLG